MTVVDYYISLNSPWTFLGSGRLIEIAARRGASVMVKPAKFAEVFAKTGGLPLAQRPPERRAYRLMELKRWRDHLKIPIVIQPKYFPADERPGAHFLLSAQRAGMDALRLSSEIGRAVWCREENIAEPEVLDAAASRAGLDTSRLRASMLPAAELEAEWDRNTAEALARGVFGAPSYVLASGEIFWGQDRIEFLDRALAGPA